MTNSGAFGAIFALALLMPGASDASASKYNPFSSEPNKDAIEWKGDPFDPSDPSQLPIPYPAPNIETKVPEHPNITSAAMATPITGGQTIVTLTSYLRFRGLTPGLFGDATIVPSPYVAEQITGGPLNVAFPITGVSLNGVDALIEHDNSGVSLTAGEGDDASSVTVGNFLIDANLDTMEGTVFGDVIGLTTGSPLEFFNLRRPENALLTPFGSSPKLGVELLITKTLATALIDVFGPEMSDLEGTPFGYYFTPEPTLASAPATTMLLTMGLLGVIATRRSRRR